ncbi:hypothetical protein RCR19_39860 [Streptomyces sp. WAC07094]|uniref:hypothetical protein n=1 Tax=Streptomyces sp. WAC07094 TaxID=3072183 RepID=UPI002EC27AB9|nr:hypothetical protein [Streptomyces sp. WAC07094]
MTLDWSGLEHAYGSASDLPRLFDEIGDPELADQAWEELWESLCHQRTVYTASFAALPVLTDIATGRRAGSRWQALALAGRIVVEEQQLHEPGYVQARFPAAIKELRELTQNHVMTEPFKGGEDEFLYWLEHLLAFEGEPLWRGCLACKTYAVVCPSCAQQLLIDLSRTPSGTRRPHPSGLVRVGREGPVLTGIRRAASADLPPLAARLYQMANHAGQPAAAEHLTRLFGRTTCPDCASDFSVPDQVVAFQASRKRITRGPSRDISR